MVLRHDHVGGPAVAVPRGTSGCGRSRASSRRPHASSRDLARGARSRVRCLRRTTGWDRAIERTDGHHDVLRAEVQGVHGARWSRKIPPPDGMDLMRVLIEEHDVESPPRRGTRAVRRGEGENESRPAGVVALKTGTTKLRNDGGDDSVIEKFFNIRYSVVELPPQPSETPAKGRVSHSTRSRRLGAAVRGAAERLMSSTLARLARSTARMRLRRQRIASTSSACGVAQGRQWSGTRGRGDRSARGAATSQSPRERAVSDGEHLAGLAFCRLHTASKPEVESCRSRAHRFDGVARILAREKCGVPAQPMRRTLVVQ